VALAGRNDRLMRHPELREALKCALPYGSGTDRVYTLEKRLHLLGGLL